MSLQPPEKLRRLQETLYAKAKQEPSYRFYLLYDKLYRPDVLQYAWARCRAKRGASGVDGQTFEDIESHGVERWLSELGEEVKAERYKPQAVRRVMIPKPGGVGERPLGIPTIRDRIVQQAAVLDGLEYQVLEHLCQVLPQQRPSSTVNGQQSTAAALRRACSTQLMIAASSRSKSGLRVS
jgi:hypothetical protein